MSLQEITQQDLQQVSPGSHSDTALFQDFHEICSSQERELRDLFAGFPERDLQQVLRGSHPKTVLFAGFPQRDLQQVSPGTHAILQD